MSEDVPSQEPLAYLFKIVDGPSYTTDELTPTLRLLSERFTGELWSYGAYEADIQVARMRLRVVKDRTRNRLMNYLHFARQVMIRAREVQAAKPSRLVITSYDPFKGGFLAWRVARLLACAFVCEVNGMYGNPDNFADNSPLWRRIRLVQMHLQGSFVLHRADGVRLLFAEQLKNFATLRPHTVLRHFFALSFTDRFHPAPEEHLVLSAGFPYQRKGMDTLVSAFIRVAAKYPDWKLVLIGHLLHDDLRASGIEHPHIKVLPGMPQAQLAPWMMRCAIFVLASRSEAMGRVLLEAAAAEKCRIATRVGGIPTVLEHGYDGMLVAKGNVDELAAGLDSLMGDAALRHRFGVAARARTEHEFSPQSYLRFFEEFISASLNAFGARARSRA